METIETFSSNWFTTKCSRKQHVHDKTAGSPNVCESVLTNKHVNVKLRLKFFNAVVTPAMLLSLHTLALTKVQLDNINVLQRKMLRTIVGWVRLNGEDWSDTVRRMNHKFNVALETSLSHHGRNNLPNANFNALPR